jgi:hypothetical protein
MAAGTVPRRFTTPLTRPLKLKEALMKKFYVLAVLPMATTSAHAGNSVSFEIDGHKIRIEAPTATGITTPRSR